MADPHFLDAWRTKAVRPEKTRLQVRLDMPNNISFAPGQLDTHGQSKRLFYVPSLPEPRSAWHNFDRDIAHHEGREYLPPSTFVLGDDDEDTPAQKLAKEVRDRHAADAASDGDKALDETSANMSKIKLNTSTSEDASADMSTGKDSDLVEESKPQGAEADQPTQVSPAHNNSAEKLQKGGKSESAFSKPKESSQPSSDTSDGNNKSSKEIEASVPVNNAKKAADAAEDATKDVKDEIFGAESKNDSETTAASAEVPTQNDSSSTKTAVKYNEKQDSSNFEKSVPSASKLSKKARKKANAQAVHVSDTSHGNSASTKEAAEDGPSSLNTEESTKAQVKSKAATKTEEKSMDTAEIDDKSKGDTKIEEKSKGATETESKSKDVTNIADTSKNAAKGENQTKLVAGDKPKDIAKSDDKSKGAAKAGDKSKDATKLGKKSNAAETDKKPKDAAKAGDKSEDVAKTDDKSKDAAKTEDRSKNATKTEETSEDANKIVKSDDKPKHATKTEKKPKDAVKADDKPEDVAKTDGKSKDAVKAENKSKNATKTEEKSKDTAKAINKPKDAAKADNKPEDIAKSDGKSKNAAKAENKPEDATKTEEKFSEAVKAEGMPENAANLNGKSKGTTRSDDKSKSTSETKEKVEDITRTEDQMKGTSQIDNKLESTAITEEKAKDTARTGDERIDVAKVDDSPKDIVCTQDKPKDPFQNERKSKDIAKTGANSISATKTEVNSHDATEKDRSMDSAKIEDKSQHDIKSESISDEKQDPIAPKEKSGPASEREGKPGMQATVRDENLALTKDTIGNATVARDESEATVSGHLHHNKHHAAKLRNFDAFSIRTEQTTASSIAPTLSGFSVLAHDHPPEKTEGLPAVVRKNLEITDYRPPPSVSDKSMARKPWNNWTWSSNRTFEMLSRQPKDRDAGTQWEQINTTGVVGPGRLLDYRSVTPQVIAQLFVPDPRPWRPYRMVRRSNPHQVLLLCAGTALSPQQIQAKVFAEKVQRGEVKADEPKSLASYFGTTENAKVQAGLGVLFSPTTELGRTLGQDVDEKRTELNMSRRLERPLFPATTTWQRAALRSVIAALEYVSWEEEGFDKIVIGTHHGWIVQGISSEYVAVLTQSIWEWRSNGWRLTRESPQGIVQDDVPNRDLWELLDYTVRKYEDVEYVN